MKIVEKKWNWGQSNELCKKELRERWELWETQGIVGAGNECRTRG